MIFLCVVVFERNVSILVHWLPLGVLGEKLLLELHASDFLSYSLQTVVMS